jgi:hypothetical protein
MAFRSLLPLLLIAAAASCGGSDDSSSTTTPPAPSSSSGSTPSPSPPNPGESNASKDVPKDTSTELVVGFDTEDFSKEGYNLTSFFIEVKVDGVVAAKEDLPVVGSVHLPHETKVVAPKDKPEAKVEITTKAVMNSADVVTRRVTTHFVKGKSVLAYVRLEIRCNNFGLLGGSGISGPTCDKPNETCVGGRCISDTLENLPDYRADWAANPPSACGNGTASAVTLGTGQSNMTPLADNDTLSVECGPQGGHHIWMAVSTKDLAQMGTTTIFSATGAASVPPTGYPYSYSPGPNGTCELVALRFQLDTAGVNIKDVLGKSLDIKVDATDKQGHKATALRHVNISPNRTGGGMCRPLN